MAHAIIVAEGFSDPSEDCLVVWAGPTRLPMIGTYAAYKANPPQRVSIAEADWQRAIENALDKARRTAIQWVYVVKNA